MPLAAARGDRVIVLIAKELTSGLLMLAGDCHIA
jgi:hypothetical protein